MKALVSYFTGCIALISVSAAVLATVHFIATDSGAGLKFATSMLGGIGAAMGACIGGALILRFKSARRFLRQLFYEKDD